MAKFTMKFQGKVWNGTDDKTVPEIKKSSTKVFDRQAPTQRHQTNLSAGDEVVIHYRTGGSEYGWFLGMSNTGKFVCISYMDWSETPYIINAFSRPRRADWTKFVASPNPSLITEALMDYRSHPSSVDYTLDLSNVLHVADDND